MEFKHTLPNVIQYGKRLYENISSLKKYLSSDDFPKTVDLCETDVGFAHKSDCREGILSDAVDSKSFLENLVRNNYSGCTRFFMCFSVFFLYNMYFQTHTIKVKNICIRFPLGNESQIPLIE